MKRNLHPNVGAEPARHGRWLLATCAAIGFPSAAQAQTDAPAPERAIPERTITIGSGPAAGAPDAPRLNTTGRTVMLTVPVKDGNTYLGDIAITIDPDDRIEFSTQRLLELLPEVVNANVIETLRTSIATSTTLTPGDFAGSGIEIAYDPRTLELVLSIPVEFRATRSIQVSALERRPIGAFETPAEFSAYLNVRASTDYVHVGAEDGWGDPVLFLDGASRLGPVVLESEGLWQPGNDAAEFQRQGTRFVVDDTENLVRWSVGDLQTAARGFQSAPDIAGISLFRSYSELQPQMIARPRGDRSFLLERPSMVEISVNGQVARRVRLDPGSYNLRDFPFTQGANDISVAIQDDAGRTETLRFNLFFDQTQLDTGLSEFGVYAGVKAPQGIEEPDYSDEWQFSGFYRRGINDGLTVGVNAQADEQSNLFGAEAVFGAQIGTIAIGAGASNIDGVGDGVAANVTYQRLVQHPDGQSNSISLFVETRSEKFGPVGTTTPDNRFEYEAGATFSHAFSSSFYATLDARHSRGRASFADTDNARASFGWRLSNDVNLRTDLIYENPEIGDSNVAGVFTLTARLGRFSSARADYDTRGDRARLSYQAIRDSGVGAYNFSADMERTRTDSAFNANANYYANRAELGASHFTAFDGDFGEVTDERTSLRAAMSLSTADGRVSVGRPIYDSFAIVTPHRSLGDAEVFIEPSAESHSGSTGALRAATYSTLSSYNERTLTVDAPEIADGVDIGQGSFRVFPPYRAGYVLEVGSDYSVTATGRMLTQDGEPLSLIAGQARELAHGEREPITMFTNRDGRYAASGLAPGRWRIEMLTEPPTIYFIDVPPDTIGLVRTGDLTPSRAGE